MNDGINENYISLKFFEFDFSPQVISEKLGLEPTKTGIKGERRNPKFALLCKSNEWTYEEFNKTNEFIGELVQSFIERIVRPRLEQIKQLATSQFGELSIAQWYYDGYNPGYHFSKEIISTIKETGLEIDIDTYCLSGT